MSGSGIVIIIVAAVTAFLVGSSWERAERALTDFRRAMIMVRAYRGRSMRLRGQALITAAIGLCVLYILVRAGGR